MQKVWFSFQRFLCLKHLRERELHEFCSSICLQLILKRNANPLKCADIFYFLSQSTRIKIQGVKIQRMEEQLRSNFNDTNGRYDVRKNDLEVILMIRTGNTTYHIRKSDLEDILMIRDGRYGIQKKWCRSHFNDTNGRYHVQKSALEMFLMTWTEYDVRKSCIDRSHFYDMNFKKEVYLLVFKLLIFVELNS